MPCPFSNNYPNRIPAVTVSGARAARLFHMANNVGQTASASHAALDSRNEASVILGRNVTRLRKQAKITKQKFALMVDVGRPFLNHIENGTADPRLSVILRLAEALETTPQELLTDPGEAPVQNAPKRHARLI